MALLWADGFDHYGSNAARLLDRVYSEINGVTLSTAKPRTGAYAARIQVVANNSGLRRVLPAETEKLGFGFPFNISALPTDTRSLSLGQVLSKTNAPLFTISVMPTGAVIVRQGGWQGDIVAESGAEVVMPESYQHFECSLDEANLEIRINSVTVINMTDLVLSAPAAQIMLGGSYGFPKIGATSIIMDIDDVFARDGSGATVNSWVGDKKAYTRMPDEDGPAQDWTPSTGTTAWQILDNVPPVDTQYLTATDVGDQVEVGFAAFPDEIVSISAIYLAARTWKTDAGSAKVSIDMVSGGDATDSVSIPVTNAPVWYGRPFDVDPETSMPWTIPSINAATARLERMPE